MEQYVSALCYKWGEEREYFTCHTQQFPLVAVVSCLSSWQNTTVVRRQKVKSVLQAHTAVFYADVTHFPSLLLFVPAIILKHIWQVQFKYLFHTYHHFAHIICVHCPSYFSRVILPGRQLHAISDHFNPMTQLHIPECSRVAEICLRCSY